MHCCSVISFGAPLPFPLSRFPSALRSAQGFIKFALQHGYSVHPVFTFGEEQTYYALTAFRGLRLKLNSFKLPGVAFVGAPRLLFVPFLPEPAVDLLTVVGAPLQLPRIEAPTHADVARWHGAYCDALQQLFDKHKAAAGSPNAQLEML